ncbi:MAG TPA: hypothetical protein ENJ93_09360 [Chloroflexi bacterium]|nr:hypothetical protein [Chloroflexota bacterium]
MTVHLYMSLIPEALIASMLSPDEFAVYYSVGGQKKTKGEAIFAEIDPDFRNDFFNIEEGIKRCAPHEDGSPKRSVYISAYRVLEHIPLESIQKLYLVTAYGEALALDPVDAMQMSEPDENLHMYQEIAPISPLVVSTWGPVDFYKSITQDPGSLIHLPAISFVELDLGELASDPEHGALRDLPYDHVGHLRECLIEVKDKNIHTKMVDRLAAPEFQYRTIKSGIYIGNTKGLVCFPLPSRDELRGKYYRWWRSANANV